jgi:hypothetical protein
MLNQKLTTSAECKPIYKGLHSALVNFAFILINRIFQKAKFHHSYKYALYIKV